MTSQVNEFGPRNMAKLAGDRHDPVPSTITPPLTQRTLLLMVTCLLDWSRPRLVYQPLVIPRLARHVRHERWARDLQRVV